MLFNVFVPVQYYHLHNKEAKTDRKYETGASFLFSLNVFMNYTVYMEIKIKDICNSLTSNDFVFTVCNFQLNCA